MTGDGYNGWTNYETWLVALWLDNEQATYEQWREDARRIWEDAPGTKEATAWGWTRLEAATHSLASALRDQLTELEEVGQSGFHTDLLRSALDEVDWHEVARHYLGDIEE
jgi:phytoene dehydrogenase-like protein